MKTTSVLPFFLTACSLIAADSATNTGLATVVSALHPVLEKLDPKPEITYSNNRITMLIGYKTQMYKVHGRSMTGEVSPSAYDEVGPSFKGFVLRVYLQNRGEVNQAPLPQTLSKPYWRTDLDVTPLAGTQKPVYRGLSYGVRTDTHVLAHLRQTLYGLRGTPNQSITPTPIR